LEGYVPPDHATWSEAQLARAAGLIRRFHDATAGSALAGGEEVVCHNDLSPCNAVFVGGMPAAFIDFDEAAPGPRSRDLGYALWMFLDLGPEGLDVPTQGRRIRMMGDAYGVEGWFDPVGAIAESQRATLERSLGRLRSASAEGAVAYARDSVAWIPGRWRGSGPTGTNSERPRGRAGEHKRSRRNPASRAGARRPSGWHAAAVI
jgi:hypothetical protein